MKKDEFVDRREESTKVSKWLTDTHDNPLFIIVAGYSGVGKTSFTRYITLKDIRRIYIRASIPKRIGNTLQAGGYLRRIAIEIDAVIRDQANNLETFEDRAKKLSREAAIQDITDSAIDFLMPRKMRKRIITIYQKFSSTGKFDWRKKLFGGGHTEFSVVREYLTEIFHHIPIGLVIENAQNIDEYSLAWIEHIASITESHAFIFEWTSKDSSDSGELKELLELFRPHCSITEILWLKNYDFSVSSFLIFKK